LRGTAWWARHITDDPFTFARNTAKIDAEAALDGVYVVRTTVAEAALDQTATVTAYKQHSLAPLSRAKLTWSHTPIMRR
jgi:hypothetical protein